MKKTTKAELVIELKKVAKENVTIIKKNAKLLIDNKTLKNEFHNKKVAQDNAHKKEIEEINLTLKEKVHREQQLTEALTDSQKARNVLLYNLSQFAKKAWYDRLTYSGKEILELIKKK